MFFIKYKKIFLIQLLAISIVVMSFLSNKVNYSSSVTVYPLLSSEILSSDVALSQKYPPKHTFSLFLKEVSKKQIRSEAYEYSLNEYRGQCEKSLITEPIVSVYKKIDRSFPMMNDVVEVKSIGPCKDFIIHFSNFLPKYINSILVKKIQDIENNFVNGKYKRLLSKYNKDVHDMESYLLNRKDVLRNFINLKKGINDGRISTAEKNIPLQVALIKGIGGYHVPLRIHSDTTINADKFIDILSSYDTARTELDYLLSVSNIDKASIGLMNQLSIVDTYNIERNFQHANLFNVSAGGAVVVVKSMYLHIFSVIIILCLGWLYIALLRIRENKV
jgi:hypothetical protein